MLLVGDVRLGSTNGPKVIDPREPFAHVAELLKREDVVFCNLEGALYDGFDAHEAYHKVPWTHAGTSGAPALHEGNFCAVGIANNVMVGDEAITATVALLDQMGIAHTGAGRNAGAARAPAIVERNGVKYGFLQRTSIFWPYRHKAVPEGPVQMPQSLRYWHGLIVPGSTVNFVGAPGVATIRPRTAYEPSYDSLFEGGGDATVHSWPDEEDLNEFLDDVRALRPQVDVLVTSHHWRLTGSDIARDYRKEIAHAAVDAGADLVIAHGTHQLDAIEVYKGKAIFYGIGELFFRFDPGPKFYGQRYKRRSLMVHAEVKDRAIGRVSCRMISATSADDDRPSVRTLSEEGRHVDRLLEASEEFGTTLEVAGDELVVIDAGAQRNHAVAAE